MLSNYSLSHPIWALCALIGCSLSCASKSSQPTAGASGQLAGAGAVAGGSTSGAAGVSTIAGRSGMSAPPSSGAAAWAGIGASGIGVPSAGGAGSMAGTAATGATAGSNVLDAGPPSVCRIPDNIMVIAADAADAGFDPECQDVPRKVIAENCIGLICHDLNGPPAGGLELMAPCVADRLVNVKSKCQDQLYIDPENPERSFLFDKLNNRTPACGQSMPQGGILPADELACMNAWIRAVIREARAVDSANP